MDGLKNKTQVYAASRRHTSALKTNKVKAQSEGIQDDIPSKWEPKECRASHPVSGKINTNLKKITRDKDGHYIMKREQMIKKTY